MIVYNWWTFEEKLEEGWWRLMWRSFPVTISSSFKLNVKPANAGKSIESKPSLGTLTEMQHLKI
jgi:hypothetical protein